MRGKKSDKEVIEKIKKLRQIGKSINEISNELKISKTIALRYIRDVKIMSDYVPFLKEKRGGSIKIKINKDKMVLEEAKIALNNLTKREKLLFLAALYWGEGSKKDFGLSNTDPNLIKTYISFFERGLWYK